MCRKKKYLLLIFVFALVLTLILIYFLPTSIGKSVDPLNVHHIYVFDGNTGVGFTINDLDDISCIVNNVKSAKLRKTKFSLIYEGYCLKVDYLNDYDENIIPTFIINSKSTIRRDPFFYETNDELCFDYIKDLEEKLE